MSSRRDNWLMKRTLKWHKIDQTYIDQNPPLGQLLYTKFRTLNVAHDLDCYRAVNRRRQQW